VRLVVPPFICRTRLLAVGFVAAVLIAIAAPAALAHATLDTVTPANDSVVAVIAKEVVLRFDEPVSLDLGAGIRVFGPNGRRVDRSVSRLRDLGKSVVVPMDDAGPGTYTVAWRVVSEDSHVLRGSSVFHVRTNTGAVDTATASASAQSRLGWLSRFLVLTGTIALLGLALIAKFVIGNGDRSMLCRLALFSATALVVGACLRFTVQVASASGRGLIDATGLWREAVSSTRPGAIDALRIGASVVAVLGALRWAHREGPRVVAIGALVSIATNSVGGHAWTASSRGSTVAADFVHQGAAGAWAGGLFALLVVLRVGDECRVTDERRVQYVSKFGRVALASAALLFVTGAWASYANVGSFGAFTSTGYGRLVLVKLAGFALMGTLGWINRRRLRSLVVNVPTTLRFEVVAAVIVLAFTASLVGSVPVRAGSQEPFYTRVETASMTIDVTVLPATIGTNMMHLYFYDASGNPERVDVATASISIRDIAPRRITLLPITGDHFTAGGFTLPMKGVWTLTLNTVRKGNVDTFTLEVPVK
jgi:copper transport protein